MIIPIALGASIIAIAAAIHFLGFNHGVHIMNTIFQRLDALEAEVAELKSAAAPVAGASEADLAALADRVTVIEGEIGTEPALVDQAEQQQG